MKTIKNLNVAAGAAILFTSLLNLNPVKAQTPVKNIVIVHGAFADASGWESVYKILVKDGYHVSLVQNPTSSLAEDVAATNFVLDRQDGPVVLVGHSWGGTVITEAGNADKVKSLVYVAAFIPDAGESTLALVEKVAAPKGILAPDAKGNVYLGKATFQETFANGQTKEKSDFMFDSQIPLTVKSFTENKKSDAQPPKSPHKAFWASMTYKDFIEGNVPGVLDPVTKGPIPILTRGDSATSNLILALRGEGPLFDPQRGAFGRMPANGQTAFTTDEINELADWIDKGCPE